MAYILLVDSDEVAQRAMKGILERGKHRLVTANSVLEAWDVIRRNVKIDLVVTELKLKGDGGLTLIQRLKGDCILKSLPLVVYTAHADRDSVKKILDLHVQNFLVKPYRDDALFAEITKVLKDPWREKYFEKEADFCQRTNLESDRLHALLDALRIALEEMHVSFGALVEKKEDQPVAEPLAKLSGQARQIGALGVVECLKEVQIKAVEPNWPDSEASVEPLKFAAQLVFEHLNPTHCPDDFLTEAEINCENEAIARALWADAVKEERCPVIGWEQLQREIDALDGCPVIDSIAASYQMSATGHPTSLSPLLDLVTKDPSLTAQILIASNRLKKSGTDSESAPIEEPRMAVGLLGEMRLVTIGRSLATVEERMLLVPSLSSWPNYRMFQLGTARLAQFVCDYLEMRDLEAIAYTAGLIHDIGKLLLIHLHPFAFQAIHDYALNNEMKLATAERFFIETTTHEMAAYFAEKEGLPKRLVNVLRWIDNPRDATEDAELVAIVSLARNLCRHNHVGFCGDTPKDDAVPLEDTPEWAVLRSRVYLNFDLKKFETRAHRECIQLKNDQMRKFGR